MRKILFALFAFGLIGLFACGVGEKDASSQNAGSEEREFVLLPTEREKKCREDFDPVGECPQYCECNNPRAVQFCEIECKK